MSNDENSSGWCSRFVYRVVAALILDLLPGVEDLCGRHDGSELGASSRRSVTVGAVLISSQIRSSRIVLAMKIARKVPGHVIARVLDTSAGRRLNDIETLLVDILEQETGILAPRHPPVHVERVLRTIEIVCNRWVFPVGEIVIVAIDDEGSIIGAPAVDSEFLSTADRFGEAKREETNAGHQTQHDADDTHLLPPRTLRFRGRFVEYASHDETGNAAGDEVTVHHPAVFWSRSDVAEAAATARVFRVASIDTIRLNSVGSLPWCLLRRFTPERRAAFEDVETGLLIRIIGFSAQQGLPSTEIGARSGGKLIVRLITGCYERSAMYLYVLLRSQLGRTFI